MNTDELKTILEQHKLWLDTNGKAGKRADLLGADLLGADLRYTNMPGADLRGVGLRDADIIYANTNRALFDTEENTEKQGTKNNAVKTMRTELEELIEFRNVLHELAKNGDKLGIRDAADMAEARINSKILGLLKDLVNT